MKKEKPKFNALTPEVLNENKKIYTEALDFAFSNKDIKNVAITGIYGSGKTTVWNTYVKEKNKSNIITVSLGKYKDQIEDAIDKTEDSETKDDNFQNDKKGEAIIDNENRIEKQIINQILSQIKSDEIPLSKYGFKTNKTRVKIFRQALTLFLPILSVLIWIIKSKFNSYNLGLDIILIMLFLPIFHFFYSYFRENNLRISKIKFRGTEANLNNKENNDETILDRDIKELVYLIGSSKTKVIVFEDLDRYDNIAVYTKLRELNFLVNKFLKTNVNNKKENEEVKFVYILKDSIFKSKNRTKFFDYIIPIVPVVDSKNSESMILNLLGDLESLIDKRLIFKISLYIDDMRLLKNIINEFIIYKNIIPMYKLELSYDKLFSLIVLKNIFPYEFDLLQEDKGYLFDIISKMENLKNTHREKIKKIIQDNQQAYNSMINNITDEKYLKLTYILKHSIEQEMKSLKFSSINIKNCNKEFIIRKTMDKKLFAYFNNDRYSNICDLLIKINLNKKILNIDKELLSIIPSSEIDEIFKNNSNILTNNKYLSLIRVLILKGYIDKTYWHYKGYFYEGSLGINDIIFIKNINELQNQDSFLELENPSEIVNRLEEDDFYKFNILNKRLLECCINENKIDYVLAIISSVSSNVEYERLAGILENYDYGIIERFVFILLLNNIDDIIELLEVTKDSYGNVYNYVLIAIYANDKIEIDKIKRFNSYIEKNSQVVELAPEDKIDAFYTNISIAGVKFTNLYGNIVNTKRIEDIERLNAYELCIENVIYIAEKISGRNIEYGNLLSEIYNSSLLQCKNYIELNFVSFINEYIEKNINNEVYVNDANILTKILNSDSSNEYKIKYLSLNSTKLYNIKDFKNTFKNEELLNYMFERDTILFNKDNVKIHYNNIGKSSNEFIDYVERNLNDSNVDEILKDNIDMCNEFINISEISDNLFKYVYKYASNHVMTIDPNLSKERVISLIKENLIEINYGNIKMLLDKSWEEEIIMWATSIEKDVQDKVIRELLSHTLEEDLVYKLVNSTILDQNAIKLINSIKSKVLIEKICSEKENLISSIIDRELSIDNINFICNNFKKFTLKNKFIEYLINNNKLNTLSNDNLNEYVMEFVLNLNNIDINTKIDLICTKIKNNIDVIFLKKYIESVTEISELAEVWDGKRPKLENEEKRKVGNMLIENGYVSKYGDVEPVRVYIPKNKKEVL